jgi:argininosuccinate lyase
MNKRLWEKGKELDKKILSYTVGNDHELDARLVKYDIRASIAHARMLSSKGYLKADECEQLINQLNLLSDSFEAKQWGITLEDEDCHTALENQLGQALGTIGEKIHLGRSRNDQVLAALRLYLIDVCDHITELSSELANAITLLGDSHPNISLPGYTHMQPAMPSTITLWASGYATEIERNAKHFQLIKKRISLNPLGSAAGYGTPGLDLDRDLVTRELGFNETQEPATSVQLSRGKAEASIAFECTLLLSDISKLCADLVLFNSQEYSFIKLSDSITTGSSIMPQKKNPDIFELGRSAVSIPMSATQEILMISAKLTSGYHRDLQRIKAPLFRAIDITSDTLEVLVIALKNVTFLPDNIKLDRSLFATEEAYNLVKIKGISFREAYREIAKKYND